jgi:lysophospholipid acyltransferase (LPLAT)-like uncharacterized protein
MTEFNVIRGASLPKAAVRSKQDNSALIASVNSLNPGDHFEVKMTRAGIHVKLKRLGLLEKARVRGITIDGENKIFVEGI